jgi:hypothetical protein
VHTGGSERAYFWHRKFLNEYAFYAIADATEHQRSLTRADLQELGNDRARGRCLNHGIGREHRRPGEVRQKFLFEVSRPRLRPNIKLLFRERDRDSMKFAFDLWSYEDVSDKGRPSRRNRFPSPCRGGARCGTARRCASYLALCGER